MKFFKNIPFLLAFALILFTCEKEKQNPWEVELKNPAQKVEVIDISGKYFDPKVSTKAFKEQFPWFQGTNTDAEFEARRKDSLEKKIYDEAVSAVDKEKLGKDLGELFARIKYYFPEFKAPQVFLYSSALQSIQQPVQLLDAEHLFIDISAFMGEKSKFYQGIDRYHLTSMNPQNILPKVSEAFAEEFVPQNATKQKFIDQIIYNGKIMTLQDAFLPNSPDFLKINYTQKQYDWAKQNETNIWNYFVENNLVFSDDTRLAERFINPGPFSKFYTEIDNQSSPQVGIFTGWQICRKFYEKKPETKLQDFLKLDATEIFNESEYKPN